MSSSHPILRRLVGLALSCAVVCTGFCAIQCVRWRERADWKTGVAVRVEPATQVIKAGKLPNLSVALINRGQQEVLLVEPGDGSCLGDRTPTMVWNHTPWLIGRMCGLINPLQADEVFRLAPGESRTLCDGALAGLPRFTRPGRYRVAVRYTHRPDQQWNGVLFEPHDAEAMQALRESAAVSAVSNTVEIVVE